MKLTEQDFARISLLRRMEGGGALVAYIEQQINRNKDTLVSINPNDTGAVAQLQGLIAGQGAVLALLNAEPKVDIKPEEAN